MSDHSLSAGERIAQVRKVEGLNQRQLAARMRYSVGQVRKVEQGERAASPAFVAAAARALGREVWELYGQPYDDPLTTPLGAEHANIPELRRVIYGDLELTEPPASLDELDRRLEDVKKLYARPRFTGITEVLPDLIRQLHVAVESEPAGERREHAYAMLTLAYGKAFGTARKLGYLDLAGMAGERTRWAARHTGDPLWVAIGGWYQALLLLCSGAYASGQHVINQAHAQVEGLPESTELFAVRGALHLRSALLAARAAKPDDAEAQLAEARDLARFVEEGVPNLYDTVFRPSNVDIHSVAVAVDLCDGAAAVKRATSMQLPPTVSPGRKGYYWIDTARGFLLHGDRDRAFKALNKARQVAPQLTRYHPQVHETARVIALQDMRTSGSLSNFVAWLGLKL